MIRYLLPLLVLGVATACASVKPKGHFQQQKVPVAPDYSQERFWAALPWRSDAADLTPDGLSDEQSAAAVDVFFLHPTTYVGKRGDTCWNGPVDDPALNLRTDESPIQFQASLFNGVGRVFAPYYRQAHLNAYFTRDTSSALQAFEVAYGDVKAAFLYYIEHYNQGRPFIIASHSQGTTHGQRLVRELIDGQPLQYQLVAAYLVGIPVNVNHFSSLRPCESPEDIGCLMSWRTWQRHHGPDGAPGILVTNPLLWTTQPTYADASLNLGGVITPFSKIRPQVADAQIHESILWTKRPHFPGSIFYTRKNYHPGDFNLFYVNVRENARLRAKVFLENHRAEKP